MPASGPQHRSWQAQRVREGALIFKSIATLFDPSWLADRWAAPDPAARPLHVMIRRRVHKIPNQGRDPVPADRGKSTHRSHDDPTENDCSGLGASRSHVRRGADRLREVRYEDRDEQSDAHAFTGGEPDAQDRLFWDPVQESAQQQPHPGGTPPGAAADALHSAIAEKECKRTSSQSYRNRQPSRGCQAFFNELERDARDKRPRRSPERPRSGGRPTGEGPRAPRR